MTYFVTGATGFIGRLPRAVAVAARQGHDLRAGPAEVGRQARRTARVLGQGERQARGRGQGRPRASEARRRQRRTSRKLKGKVTHFFHLGAVYDIEASAESMQKANIAGTQGALDVRRSRQCGLFPPGQLDRRGGAVPRHVHRGHVRGGRGTRPSVSPHQARFRGAWCAPTGASRSASIARAPSSATRRPASSTRSTDPYYFFKALQKLRESWPRCDPAGRHRRRLHQPRARGLRRRRDGAPLAPARGLDGRCFHLTDPKPRRVGEMLNIFARAAHAPEMAFRLDPKIFEMVPERCRASRSSAAGRSRTSTSQVLRDLQVPT